MSISIKSFIGQERSKEKLTSLVNAALKQQMPLPHILLCGPPEMGKATLAQAIAHDLNVDLRSAEAASIEKRGDLGAIFTNLKPRDLLLLRNLDSLRPAFVQAVRLALTDWHVEIVIGEGPGARSIKMPLPEFTLIATTSHPSQVDHQLRRRMIRYNFGAYSPGELIELVALLALRSTHIFETDAIALIAEYCDGSVGNAQLLLARITEINDLYGRQHVTRQIAEECLVTLGLREADAHQGDLEERLERMTGIEFEEYVALLFRRRGYSVETTRATGDHGIDLILRKGDSIDVVQCKRWGAAVGEPVIRDFYGALLGTGAKIGYLITTSSFTESARSFAQGKPIKLIDRAELATMAGSIPASSGV